MFNFFSNWVRRQWLRFINEFRDVVYVIVCGPNPHYIESIWRNKKDALNELKRLTPPPWEPYNSNLKDKNESTIWIYKENFIILQEKSVL